MKFVTFALLLISASTAAFAQPEFGVAGGTGFLDSVSATSSTGSATAGFAPGFLVGFFLGENFYRSHNLSGEVRYEYMESAIRLSASGQSAQFSGAAHAIHYDVLYHISRPESRMQFFGVLGGGIKVFLGTGTEEAYQPLSQYGYFTKTQTFRPMVTGGAGVKFALKPKLFLRAELRDFITPFPTAVLTPAPGVKYGSLLHDIVPMVSVVFQK